MESEDYWVKIVEILQQNWALIEEYNDGCVTVFFLKRLKYSPTFRPLSTVC